jgi:hypothetical protein
MNSCSIEDTELLFTCMQQRRDVLLAVRFLTEAQVAASQMADVNVLLGILARKEALLEEFALLNRTLMSFQQPDPEQRLWASPARRQECQSLASEGNRLLAEIIKIDEATLTDMTNHRDAIASQLQNGTDSILAHNAYTAGEQLSDSFLDLSNQ